MKQNSAVPLSLIFFNCCFSPHLSTLDTSQPDARRVYEEGSPELQPIT